CRSRVVEMPLGKLDWIVVGFRDTDGEDVGDLVFEESLPVEIVASRGDDLDVAVALLLRGNVGGESDAIAVGRPRNRFDTMLAVGDLARLPTGNRQQEELGLFVLPVRGEGNPLAIRGPPRRRIGPLAGGQGKGIT